MNTKKQNDNLSKNLSLDILKWRSRRGMLELDILLIEFIDKNYELLSDADKIDYKLLLEENDTDLYSWFVDGNEVANDNLKSIVKKIKDYSTLKK